MNAASKLREYGLSDYYLANGTLVQVFASNTLPLTHLLRENWGVIYPCGHFRSVGYVISLKDGTPGGLYVKSAERVFTAEPRILAKGNFWWGGSRSGEKSIFLPNQPLVEEQTAWEAAYLLELDRLEIPAEKPQALITYPNGNKELLTKEIVSASGFTNCLVGNGNTETTAALADAGFLPDDLQAMVNHSGHHIIDVNRWSWPPFTNSSRENLLKLVVETTSLSSTTLAMSA